MIVVIVAICAMAGMRMARYRAQQHGSSLTAPPADDGEKAVLRREVEDLRERVRVLERIATDTNTTAALESRRVSDEIEALRDSRTS
jgi:hypothetical protein